MLTPMKISSKNKKQKYLFHTGESVSWVDSNFKRNFMEQLPKRASKISLKKIEILLLKLTF